jgi:hypothetical protein
VDHGCGIDLKHFPVVRGNDNVSFIIGGFEIFDQFTDPRVELRRVRLGFGRET